MDDIDALIFPGGFGAAKNLCTMAVKGEDAEVHPDVSRLVKEFQNKQKPQAAVCIAPAMYAKIFENESVSPTLTIGNDKDWSQKIENLGSKHQDCEVEKIVIDKENKIITSPAYMLGKSISEVAEGYRGDRSRTSSDGLKWSMNSRRFLVKLHNQTPPFFGGSKIILSYFLVRI